MRAAGIDYGVRRIGVAISDASGTLARPLAVLKGDGDPRAAARRAAEELRRWATELGDVVVVVVGLPRRLDGTANELTGDAEIFASCLAGLVPARVVLQDERLTSHEADQLLAERERDWRVRKTKVDAAAAAVILQEYLDGTNRPSGTAGPPGESGAGAP